MARRHMAKIRGGSLMNLESNFETLCVWLAKVPHFRTIRLHFLVQESQRSPRPLSRAKCRPLDLLGPLELVRRANPEVLLKVPDYCSVSTAELADQQQECSMGF